jgi:hypothetical protein
LEDAEGSGEAADAFEGERVQRTVVLCSPTTKFFRRILDWRQERTLPTKQKAGAMRGSGEAYKLDFDEEEACVV